MLTFSYIKKVITYVALNQKLHNPRFTLLHLLHLKLSLNTQLLFQFLKMFLSRLIFVAKKILHKHLIQKFLLSFSSFNVFGFVYNFERKPYFEKVQAEGIWKTNILKILKIHHRHLQTAVSLF